MTTHVQPAPGTPVKITGGAFKGHQGVVLGETAVDANGLPLPTPNPGHFWIKVLLSSRHFQAHLHADEFELALP